MIGYDARMALGRYRGMGAYLRELIRGRERELLGFCASGEGDTELRLVPGGARFFPAWEQLSLPPRLKSASVTTFLAPYNTAPLRLAPGLRLVLVVHDLIFLSSHKDLPFSPSLYQNAGRLYRKWVVPLAVRRADRILAVSHATERQLVEELGVESSRIRVIPNTIDESWFELPARSRAEPNLSLLCISGEAPSKNLDGALQALAHLHHKHGVHPRVQIAGVSSRFHAPFIARAHMLGLANSIEWLPYIELAELQRRMSAAALVFVPSMFEGFGRPVLEAMAAGVPVVAANIPALLEVGGDAARYCDPRSPVRMAEELAHVLASETVRETMRNAGRVQARKHHPAEIRRLIEAFWAELDYPDRDCNRSTFSRKQGL